MFSTLTLVSIFTEIFASGILISGVYTFVKKFFESKNIKDLLLSLIFFSFLIYIILTVTSQIFFNLRSSLADLIFIHRLIATNLIIGSFFVFWFIRYRLKFKRASNFLLILAFAATLYSIFRIFVSPVNLTYRTDIIEPIVTFLLFPISNPDKLLWALVWGLLGLLCFMRALRSKGTERILTFYTAASALLFVLSFFCIQLYLRSEQSLYLLISWVINLLGIILLALGESLPFDSKYARNPLNFLRSRILFKLILIFVLLIVILFEITTLATLSISKDALKGSILQTYEEAALGLKSKLEDIGRLDPAQAQKIIAEKRIGRSGIAYVVDNQGRLTAHPDPNKARLRKDLSSLNIVKDLLKNKSGGGEFPPDEFGQIKVGAYVPLKFGGGLVVEEPITDAYFKLRQLETNSLIFIIAGIILTVVVGIFFAQSIERPIHKLLLGTEAISQGDLSYHIQIDSIDELGTLAQAFNKMTQDLKDSQEKLILSEKLASLGTMAAGMAHEIKNPLVSLRTFTQLLQQKWEDRDFRDKFSSIVPAEIERINRIAESLLKFGRPMKPELKKLNLTSILEEVLLLLESECKKNNIQVTTKFTKLPDIIGDSGQLSQALLNIVLNAIQSMAERQQGGNLIIKTDVGEVLKLGRMGKAKEKADGEIVWEAEETREKPIPAVFIEISDSGPGIETEKIKSLFDPFFTTKVKGTGMGLPITLRIIEEHKGSIKVKSQAGKGTAFLITLPQNLEEV